MARTSRALVALLAVASWVAPAAAGTLSVTYQITGGTVIAPPGGEVKSGMYTVDFDALGSFTIVPGPAILKSLSFSGFDTYTRYGDFISTRFNLQLAGEVSGNGTVNSRFRNAAPASLRGTAAIHCSGGTCPAGGFVPSVTQYGPMILTAPMSAIAINRSTANISGGFQIVGVTSGFFSMSLIGQEISRTFVPEPHAHGMVLAAIVSIGWVGAWLRRPRPSMR